MYDVILCTRTLNADAEKDESRDFSLLSFVSAVVCNGLADFFPEGFQNFQVGKRNFEENNRLFLQRTGSLWQTLNICASVLSRVV